MKSSFARLIGPLVLVAGAGSLTAQASPADNTIGTVAPSPATMAVPVQPMPAAEAAKTEPVPQAPSAPAAQAAAAAPASAAATIPGAAAPAAAPAADASAPGAPAAQSAEEEKLAVRKTANTLGLKPRTKSGTEVYCKSSAEIGTRMQTLNCYTKDEVLQLKKNSQANQDDISNMQRSSLTQPNKG